MTAIPLVRVVDDDLEIRESLRLLLRFVATFVTTGHSTPSKAADSVRG